MRQITIVIFIFILFSCKKENEKNPLRLTDNIKEWTLYKVDSYWIYQNDSNHFIYDTVTVISYSDKPLIQPDLIDDKIVTDEHMFIRLANWHHTPFQPNWIFYGSTIVKATNDFEVIDEFHNFGFCIDTIDIKFNGDTLNYTKIQSDKYIRSFEYLKVYKINDKIFSDVIHIKSESIKPDYINNFGIIYINNFEYWISKNNWIIKKVLNYNNKIYSLSLIDSKIVK
jgi:hypothetical protein